MCCSGGAEPWCGPTCGAVQHVGRSSRAAKTSAARRHCAWDARTAAQEDRNTIARTTAQEDRNTIARTAGQETHATIGPTPR